MNPGSNGVSVVQQLQYFILSQPISSWWWYWNELITCPRESITCEFLHIFISTNRPLYLPLLATAPVIIIIDRREGVYYLLSTKLAAKTKTRRWDSYNIILVEFRTNFRDENELTTSLKQVIFSGAREALPRIKLIISFTTHSDPSHQAMMMTLIQQTAYYYHHMRNELSYHERDYHSWRWSNCI